MITKTSQALISSFLPANESTENTASIRMGRRTTGKETGPNQHKFFLTVFFSSQECQCTDFRDECVESALIIGV